MHTCVKELAHARTTAHSQHKTHWYKATVYDVFVFNKYILCLKNTEVSSGIYFLKNGKFRQAIMGAIRPNSFIITIFTRIMTCTSINSKFGDFGSGWPSTCPGEVYVSGKCAATAARGAGQMPSQWPGSIHIAPASVDRAADKTVRGHLHSAQAV